LVTCQEEVIRRILVHCELWNKPPVRPPPTSPSPIPLVTNTEDGDDYLPDYSVFEDTGYAD